MNFTEDTDGPLVPGGTVRYLVHDAHGRFVGYIGDRNGKWWATYCPDPDAGPYWTGRRYKSKENARKALVKVLVGDIMFTTFPGLRPVDEGAQ